VSAGTISGARKRVLAVQARRGELRLAKERNELLDATVIRTAWTAAVAAFRAHMLGLPRALAETLTHEAAQGPSAIEAVLTDAIRDALTTLSDWQPPPAAAGRGGRRRHAQGHGP